MHFFCLYYLASPDALEVMLVTESLSISTDLTDVTLVSDDMYLLKTWLMLPEQLRILKKMKKKKK